MIAQVYKDDCEMRIFDRYNILLATIELGTDKSEIELKTSADNALKNLRMKRCEKWCNVEWGNEAKVRFK